jgi:hypothetical protein
MGIVVSIGVTEMAEKAKALEETGKNGNLNIIREDTNTFTTEPETPIAQVRTPLADDSKTTGGKS